MDKAIEEIIIHINNKDYSKANEIRKEIEIQSKYDIKKHQIEYDKHKEIFELLDYEDEKREVNAIVDGILSN